MHCRVCSNQDVQLVERIDSPNCDQPVPVYRCPDCGHFSLFPDQYQQQKAFDWDGVDYYLHDIERRRRASKQVIDRLYNAFSKANGRRPGNFLDAGCAIGLALEIAEAKGLQATGVEPETRLADYGIEHLGVDIRKGMLGQVALTAGAFDLVFCEQVLEHVPNPPQFVQALKRQLAPDGMLYIGVPPVLPINRFSTFLLRKLKLPVPDTVLTNIFHDPDEHINVFTRQSMQKLASNCNMNLEVLPLGISQLTARRVLKHVLALGSSPGTYILSNMA